MSTWTWTNGTWDWTNNTWDWEGLTPPSTAELIYGRFIYLNRRKK